MLALTGGTRIHAAGCFRREFGKFRAVEMIAVQARHVLFLGGVEDFIDAALDCGLLLRMGGVECGGSGGRAANQ